jgi:hypothetical protein
MMRLVFVLGALALAVPAPAQTKIGGTLQCAKPAISQSAEVGDHPGHVLALAQDKCTWTKPMEIDGVETKDDVGTGISDIRGSRSSDRGYDVTTMANGDKLFVRSSGSTTIKGEMADSGAGRWSFAGGTGKFKGIKGSGTFKMTGSRDGSATIDVEGDYTLPAAKK